MYFVSIVVTDLNKMQTFKNINQNYIQKTMLDLLDHKRLSNTNTYLRIYPLLSQLKTG